MKITLQIEEMTFEKHVAVFEAELYEKSGFYFTENKEYNNIDLVFVDKNIGVACMVCPKETFLQMFTIENEPIDIKIEKPIFPDDRMIPQDFIIEFAKVLLNKK